MRKAAPESDLIKKNAGEKLFTDMMDMEVAKQTAEGQSVGLSEMLYESLSKNIPSTGGNNFPEGKESAVTGAEMLELRKKINGIDVAHEIVDKL
jgi:Rod binding domain-containing protein